MNPQLILALTVLTILSTPALSLSETDKKAAIQAASFEHLRECAAEMQRPLAIDADGMDLNGDGIEEVMITVRHEDGGAACFNQAGQTKTLMIKNASGQWMANLGFGADEITLLSEKVDGYPDLEIEGLGYCSPIWRWNGSKYAIHKQCQNGKLVTVQARAPSKPRSNVVSATSSAARDPFDADWAGDCRPDVDCWIKIRPTKKGLYSLEYRAVSTTSRRKEVCRSTGFLRPSMTVLGGLSGTFGPDQRQRIDIVRGPGDMVHVVPSDNAPCGFPLRVGGIYDLIAH